jgi:predicted HNH restriction endonuclease
VKKNKMKKKLIENETTDTETNRIKEKETIKSIKTILSKTSVDSKEKPNLKTKENNENESSIRKFKDVLPAKECPNKDEFQIESLNIDSLISSYKQETEVDLEDPLVIFSDEDEDEEEV